MQKVIPAILTKDPADLKAKLKIFKGKSKWMHIDIMDGKFVEDVSVDLLELTDSARFFDLEIHLMVQDPLSYFEDCKKIKAKRVFFHYEAENDVAKLKKEKGKYNFQIGLAINPPTGVQPLLVFKNLLDSILLLGVEPGAQGREFIPSVFWKAQEARLLCPDVLLGIDGGINEKNILTMFKTRIDFVVVGSAVMQKQDPATALRNLEEMVK